MKLIRGLQNIPKDLTNTAVTVGDFDGVHLGHQTVIHKLKDEAQKRNLKTVLICFEPQPVEFFWKEKAQGRIMRLREKLIAFKKLNLDYVLCLPFNAKMANLNPEEFVTQLLVDALGCNLLVIGDDFCCGKKRAGNADVLHILGAKYHFELIQLQTFVIEHARDSSTRIRKALSQGAFHLVEELLGQQYSLNGKVIHGDARGKELGYPTANIALQPYKMALTGIFVVEVDGLGNKPSQGVANIGVRPTFKNKGFILEVYLLDFDQDIYGKTLNVRFLKKVRNEMKFDSLEDLKKQMAEDVEVARNYLSKRKVNDQ